MATRLTHIGRRRVTAVAPFAYFGIKLWKLPIGRMIVDHFATKRYVRNLVQGEDFDELDFLKQTSRIPPGDLRRVLGAVAEEMQQELTALVNEEFESFVKLFNDIGDVGQEEFQDFEIKVSNLYKIAQV